MTESQAEHDEKQKALNEKLQEAQERATKAEALLPLPRLLLLLLFPLFFHLPPSFSSSSFSSSYVVCRMRGCNVVVISD